MATTKSGVPLSTTARISAEDTADGGVFSPAKPKSHSIATTTVISQPAREALEVASENSPAVRAAPRGHASPTSRLPKASVASPLTSRISPLVSALPRTVVASAEQRQSHRAPDGFGASLKPAMQPIHRGPPIRPNGNGHRDTVSVAINDIRHDDPDRSVDALKTMQGLLENEPNAFLNNVRTLTDTLLDEMERAFTPLENLLDSRYFRLVKHLIQTFSHFSSNQDLMRRLTYDDVYAILSALTLRLVQLDRMGGTIAELGRFINMILVQTLATPPRLLVFQVMFRLLLNLSREFSAENVQQDAEEAAHADLVLKCLWKRYRILDDDLKNARVKPGPLLAVLEEFMQGVGPSEYRRRKTEGIALGDMPLRTVKTIIQRIISEPNQLS